MRKGNVFLRDLLAGVVVEDQNGYTFTYDKDYLLSPDAEAISLTMQKLQFKNLINQRLTVLSQK